MIPIQENSKKKVQPQIQFQFFNMTFYRINFNIKFNLTYIKVTFSKKQHIEAGNHKVKKKLDFQFLKIYKINLYIYYFGLKTINRICFY